MRLLSKAHYIGDFDLLLRFCGYRRYGAGFKLRNGPFLSNTVVLIHRSNWSGCSFNYTSKVGG